MKYKIIQNWLTLMYVKLTLSTYDQMGHSIVGPSYVISIVPFNFSLQDLTDPNLAEQEQVKYHTERRWVWQIIVVVL